MLLRVCLIIKKLEKIWTNLSWHNVIRTTSKFGIEAAALLVGPVGGMNNVFAAPELRVFTRGGLGATFEVRTFSLCLTIRTATMLLKKWNENMNQVFVFKNPINIDKVILLFKGPQTSSCGRLVSDRFYCKKLLIRPRKDNRCRKVVAIPRWSWSQVWMYGFQFVINSSTIGQLKSFYNETCPKPSLRWQYQK